MLRPSLERRIAFIGLSIPFTLVLALWKAALLFVVPSLFLFATVLFGLGVVAVKIIALRHLIADTRATWGSPNRPAGTQPSELHRGVYGSIGVLVLLLSLVYVVCSALGLDGEGANDDYTPAVAINIAAITFAEIAVSIRGAVTARRSKELVVEAVRLTNLASALVLLVLTQTALLSFAQDSDLRVYNAFCGVLFGSLAALIAMYMIVRAYRAREPRLEPTAPTEPTVPVTDV